MNESKIQDEIAEGIDEIERQEAERLRSEVAELEAYLRRLKGTLGTVEGRLETKREALEAIEAKGRSLPLFDGDTVAEDVAVQVDGESCEDV